MSADGTARVVDGGLALPGRRLADVVGELDAGIGLIGDVAELLDHRVDVRVVGFRHVVHANERVEDGDADLVFARSSSQMSRARSVIKQRFRLADRGELDRIDSRPAVGEQPALEFPPSIS